MAGGAAAELQQDGEGPGGSGAQAALTPRAQASRRDDGVTAVSRRGGREAEGGGLLNRYTGITRIVGSNPIPSASP